MDNKLFILLSALLACCAVEWIFKKILKIAKIKNLVDNPNARKLQKTPVPMLGGVAVYFGFLVGLSFARCFEPGMTGMLPIVIASSIMIYTGAVDDITGISPRARIIIESMAICGLIFSTGTCIDSLHGLFGVYQFSWYIGVPLTVFAGVGIINAFNMVDGVNGLSSGLCITVSLLMGVFFAKRADWEDASIAFCFAGALLPFLLHNVFGKKSRMFIGDAGTMVMGMLVTWCCMVTLSVNGVSSGTALEGPNNMCLPAMLVAIACVPVFDTLRVMTARALRHESPFHADKTHLHHKFIAVGFSHYITALSEININLAVVAVWYVTYKLGCSQFCQLLATVVAAMVLVWGTYFFLSHHEEKGTKFLTKLREITAKTHWGHSGWWLKFQRVLDRHSYEDLTPVVMNKFEGTEELQGSKEKMINAAASVINFLQDKKEVDLQTISENLAIKEHSVSVLVSALAQRQLVNIVEFDEEGYIKKVKINKQEIE